MSLLIQLTIILAFALVLVPFTKHLGLPTLIGYVVTGILLGPYALDLISMSFELKQIQHLGLLLLLFLIGLQFSTTRLSQLRSYEIQLPSYALFIPVLIFALVGVFVLKLALLTSVIVAAALSLVSFSLVQQQVKSASLFNLKQRSQLFNFSLIHSLYAAVGIACLPLLSSISSPQQGLAYVMSVIAAISGLVLLQRYVLQPVFDLLENTKTHELILASTVFTASVCFIALDTLGIHDTLAALLAGFLVSDSRFYNRISQHMQIIKGLVFAAFFIVLGMSLPLDLLITQPAFLSLTLVGVFLLKTCVYLGLQRYFKSSWQDSSLVTSGLLSAGEFGFILLYLAFENQMASAHVLEPYLLVVMLSFLLSPLFTILTQRYLLPRLSQAPVSHNTQNIVAPLLIIGFGRVGQLVARVAHLHHIQFTALDNSLDSTQDLAAYGGHLFEMDATDPTQIAQLDLNQTQLVVVAIDDVEDNINIVRYLQLNYPDLQLLVRARDRHHAHVLAHLGITQIWRETYLSTLDLAKHSLHALGIKADDATKNLAQFRIHDQMLQRQQQQIEYDDIKLYQTQEAALDELLYLLQQDCHLKTALDSADATHLAHVAKLQQMKANDL
jgi:glutathione-regulated potassium-efflux system protein KefB